MQSCENEATASHLFDELSGVEEFAAAVENLPALLDLETHRGASCLLSCGEGRGWGGWEGVDTKKKIQV